MSSKNWGLEIVREKDCASLAHSPHPALERPWGPVEDTPPPPGGSVRLRTLSRGGRSSPTSWLGALALSPLLSRQTARVRVVSSKGVRGKEGVWLCPGPALWFPESHSIPAPRKFSTITAPISLEGLRQLEGLAAHCPSGDPPREGARVGRGKGREAGRRDSGPGAASAEGCPWSCGAWYLSQP